MSKLDIVQELLTEPETSPPSMARQCAEAAQRLYQAARALCERFHISAEGQMWAQAV